MIKKVKSQKSKFLILTFGFAFLLFTFAFTCYAEEVTILFTGETHGMIYPCSCPMEPDGGVSRRAALIKQIRAENPNTLLVDSGNFFAGGSTDDYSQNVELDRERARLNLKAMGLMRYDAAGLGPDEFNFGSEFLKENISGAPFALLSCNIQQQDKGAGQIPVKPYVIRELAGVKFGIIGLTSALAKNKIPGMDFIDYKAAAEKAIAQLKKSGVDVIILLANIPKRGALDSIKEVKGIDIVFLGTFPDKSPLPDNLPFMVLEPAWQGRKLGKLSLTLKNKKIIQSKPEYLRLSNQIKDDDETASILPRCFSDSGCKKEGFTAQCEGGGTLNSRCVFTEPNKVKLVVILPGACTVCNAGPMVSSLEAGFPGIDVSYLNYPDDEKAKKMVRGMKVKFLPAYFVGKEIEKENNFPALEKNLHPAGNFYMIDHKITGFGYLLEKKRQEGSLDLFVSLYGENTKELLDAIRDFKPVVHFLVSQDKGSFSASGGEAEIEEAMRSLCVRKYYPDIFWDYITCRAGNINSSWWEDCLGNKDSSAIKKCSRTEEAKTLLKENIKLNKELEIMFGPTYLLDNQEIFSTRGVATKEELKKIMKK